MASEGGVVAPASGQRVTWVGMKAQATVLTVKAVPTNPPALSAAPFRVKEFVAAYNLEEESELAVRLAKRVFPAESKFAFEVREIADDGFEILVIKACVPLGPEAATESYFNFLSEWAKSASKARERMCLKVVVV